MSKLGNSFFKNASGGVAAEYALIMSIMTLGIAIGITSLANTLALSIERAAALLMSLGGTVLG